VGLRGEKGMWDRGSLRREKERQARKKNRFPSKNAFRKQRSRHGDNDSDSDNDDFCLTSR
jgi:hypothetical protein